VGVVLEKLFLKRGVMSKQWDKEMEKIDTTIGDLVEAITQIALESGKSEEEGYELAAVAIESILRRNLRNDPIEDVLN
jgi:hypothetical protein